MSTNFAITTMPNGEDISLLILRIATSCSFRYDSGHFGGE
jgi:hypothetical protein